MRMKKFPLLNAPERAVDLIIGLMDMKEQVKLSLCSTRAEDSVKRTKPQIKQIDIAVCGFRSTLTIHSIKNTVRNMLIVCFHEEITKTCLLKAAYKKTELAEFYMVKSDDPGLGAVHLARRLSSIFNVKESAYKINFDYCGSTDLENVLTTALVLPYDKVMVDGLQVSEITPNDFRILMDHIDLNANLIIRCVMPDDFKHEKALKFKSIDYHSAKWVTYKDLISLRNQKSITLGKNSLNIKDINNFLLYWVNCEEDMVEQFKFTLKEGSCPNERNVLNSLTCSFGNTRRAFHCSIMARNTEKRKQILGQLTILKESQSVTFQTFEDNKESRETLRKLKYIQKLKDMRMEIRDLEEKEIEKRKIYDEMEDGNPMKEGVQEEIERISNEIKEKENKMNGVRILLLGTQFRYAIL